MDFRVFFIALLISLTGCSAVGIVETSNPHEKIEQAIYLLNVENRPILADKLLAQAINLFEQQHDQMGLVRAYRARGHFLLSDSVKSSSEFFIAHGFFIDGDIYERREEKALEYFLKVREILDNDPRPLYAAKVQINMTLTETYANYSGTPENVCKYLKDAVFYQSKFQEGHPEENVAPLSGYNQFADFESKYTTKFKCT